MATWHAAWETFFYWSQGKMITGSKAQTVQVCILEHQAILEYARGFVLNVAAQLE
jgi:hypothetical protein